MASATWENASFPNGYVAVEERAPSRTSHMLARSFGRPLARAWRRLPVVARAAVCVVIAAAGAAAIAFGAPAGAPIVLGAIVLVCAGVLTGWSVGLVGREGLERVIDDRQHELWHALAELEVAQAETVRRLSMAVEFRDEDTGAHIERIGRLSAQMAEEIGLDPAFCMRLGYAAPLHDVGKVAIPDAILLKPGPLTPAERTIVETHAEEGHRLLSRSSSSILDLAAVIALSHHEKWDGTGYPRGLAGEEIPIEGRIVAVTDVFDALTSDRVYRNAYSKEQAIAMMKEQRGRHFDPILLDAFLELIGAVRSEAAVALLCDPEGLVAPLQRAFTSALEHGDAIAAEEAIAEAIEQGIAPATLHRELIAPAMRSLDMLRESGDVDVDVERRATAIVRRILATVYRYMITGSEPGRERVLLASVEGDAHTLGLQMAHDQLMAEGFRATLVSDLSPERLADTIESQAPEVVVIGGTSASVAPAMRRLLEGIRELHPRLPVLLGGAAAMNVQPHGIGVITLERLELCVPAVEKLLTGEPSTTELARA
jgi:HD-GYP domain-containing protein (c-di-GMP phosphodiesterase class II)/methylmalonyl-CoA mutase cobalamin-binding subunit